MSASRDWKKDVAKAAIVALPMLAPLVAGAKIDYEGVGYLGGSDKIDVNNANVRVYSRFPGMYPSVAGKIVSHGPYKVRKRKRKTLHTYTYTHTPAVPLSFTFTFTHSLSLTHTHTHPHTHTHTHSP
jgi:hypothetical protein